MKNKLSLRRQNNPEYNSKFFENRIKAAREKSILAKKSYLLNPNSCQSCKTIFSYEKRQNKFCSQSCAAIFNNALRDKSSHAKRALKIKEAYIKKHGEKSPFSAIYYVECKKCQKVFTHHGRLRLYCHQCPMEDRKLYRASCKFNLNNRDHTFLFNGDLIKKYGWYSPSNSNSPNIDGVTWDHLFRIEDGFILNVTPER